MQVTKAASDVQGQIEQLHRELKQLTGTEVARRGRNALIWLYEVLERAASKTRGGGINHLV